MITGKCSRLLRAWPNYAQAVPRHRHKGKLSNLNDIFCAGTTRSCRSKVARLSAYCPTGYCAMASQAPF